MEAASMVQRTQPSRSSSHSFPHVLFVGHDHIYNQEIQRLLHLCCFQVTTLTQPSIAMSLLRKIRNGHFQLLMIDIDRSIHLAPFMSLKNFGLQMGLPVVILSKQENHSLMQRVLKSGVCCFLIKPINVEMLRSTCDQYAVKKNSLLQNAISKMWAKKDRITWDLDLHHRFLEVVSKLGPKCKSTSFIHALVKDSTPANILTHMNVPGLTRKNVSSHLQCYLNYIKRYPNGNHFPSYLMPGKASSSSSSYNPTVGNFINSSLNHNQSNARKLHNINLMSSRGNVRLCENPINRNIEIQTMSIDKDGNDSSNLDISNNFSILNEIPAGITANNHHPKFTTSSSDLALLNFNNDIDRPTSPYPSFPESYDQVPDSPNEILDGITSNNPHPESTPSLDLALLNFNNDIDRPPSPYPSFPESYDQVPDSPSITDAIDQLFSSLEPHQALENNHSQPNPCFPNVEPVVSLEFNSSNLECLYSAVGIPANFSNSNQVTRSTKDNVQWVVGSNPSNNGDDDYDPFDLVSSCNITQRSSFPSHQFDEVDFEGLFH